MNCLNSEMMMIRRVSTMLAAVASCTAFMGPAPIVSRRHMSKIAMNEATRDPEPDLRYDANAGW